MSEYTEKKRFGLLSLNNSEIFRLSFEYIFLVTLDTYTKKTNPSSIGSSGVGGGGGARYDLLAHRLHYFITAEEGKVIMYLG